MRVMSVGAPVHRALIPTAAMLVLAMAVFSPAAAQPDANWTPFAARYDGNAPVLIKGRLTSVDWSGPHVWLSVVEAEKGTLWKFEGGAPEVLVRTNPGPDALLPGSEVVVRGFQSKDKSCAPECTASGRDITLTDGRKVFLTGRSAP